MIETFDKIGICVKLNNINFNINRIVIENTYTPPINNHWPNHFLLQSRNEIKIIAETSNNNYIALEKWLELSKNYKKDINSNGFFIGGIFPIDYTFNQYNIKVTFSADYMNGDFNSFKLKQLRKEKLKKLNKICQNNEIKN